MLTNLFSTMTMSVGTVEKIAAVKDMEPTEVPN